MEEKDPAASPPLPSLDVVMKGGITSGIVYPRAIHELSRRYRFRSIGGTSAGAIAAAATAAAEYRRQNGDTRAFDDLADLPDRLSEAVGRGGPSRLFSLFQPQPETAPVFNSLVAALGKKTATGRIVAFALGVVRSFLPTTVVVLLLCGALATGWTLFNWRLGSALVAAAGLVPVAFLTAAVLAAALAFRLARRLAVTLPANFFGLCTGFAQPPPAPDCATPPLTAWLYALLNDLAGLPRERPLTFGDLWRGNPNRPEKAEEDEPADPSVRLQMMTTNLTHGRPYRVPFLDQEQRLFYYKSSELEKLFPPAVMKWMEEHQRPASREGREFAGFLRLPLAADLPVIVGVRMSLSFPILISAVPLYAMDYTGEGDQPERCWFSDGGIASNFPVHFFDGPIPRWPTVAINLRPYHRHRPEDHVFKPSTNGSGLEEWWTVIERGSSWGSLTAFLGALVETMQNWMDNTQLRLPGYRDRVAHVSLREDEGGLNLNMPQELIQDLGSRGRQAAKLLAGDLAGEPRPDGKTPAVTWDNHRWVRLRTYLSLLAKDLGKVNRTLAYHEAWERSYLELVRRSSREEPKSYPLGSAKRRRAVEDALGALTGILSELEEAEFAKGAPRPEPELRVRPRI